MQINLFGYTLDVQFYKTKTIEQLVIKTWVEEGRVAAIRFYRNNAGRPISLKDGIEYSNMLVQKHPLLRHLKG